MIDRGAGELLKLLPVHDTAVEDLLPKDLQADLVVGCFDNYELLVCKECSIAGQSTLQYCSQGSNEVVRS